MSEPTKGQIDEAREMVPIFDGYLSTVNGCPHISVHGLARLISHVRKQARDDALEGAIVAGGIWVHADHIAQFNASLRALKDKPDGEA